jgi:hypothetical protein
MHFGVLHKRPKPASAYEADYHRWTKDQASALREQRLAEIDWENVAEEIESLGRSDRREIESRLAVILEHLLKWQFQPEHRSASWRASLIEQRSRIQGLLRESPSLKSYPAAVLDSEYRLARLKAAGESGLSADRLPEQNPYTIEQVLDENFLPGGAT